MYYMVSCNLYYMVNCNMHDMFKCNNYILPGQLQYEGPCSQH